MKIAVIIPAAGASTRYQAAGGLRSKLDEDLGGKPVLQRTVEFFTKLTPDDDVTISQIIVAGPADPEVFSEFKDRYADKLGLMGARLVVGGATHRWETVRNALAHVDANCTHVAVHDGARPCVSEELANRVIDAARTHHAAIPALDVPDTLKRTMNTGEVMGGADPVAAILGASSARAAPLIAVQETLDRSQLVLVQTPQVFAKDLLQRAYAQADLTGTDDAQLVERLGVRVVVVKGDVRNIKITHPADAELARAILGIRGGEGRSAHKRF